MPVTDLINPATSIGKAINLLLTFLEKISEENIWKSVLGERLVNLGQKYFGNDFVALSLAIYIAPILKTNWNKLIEMIFRKVINSDTVSIKIFSSNTLYSNISKYVFEHGPSRGKLATGVAEYGGSGVRNYTDTDYYDDDDGFYDYESCDGSWSSGQSNDSSASDDSLKVQLLPPPNFVEELKYKGKVVRVSFVEGTADVSEHIELSMKGTDTKLLHIIIQEWSDLYNIQQVVRYVYRANGCCWNYERELPQRSLDSVHLRDGQKEKLIKDMEIFRSRADWYHKRGIPHRRGYLLYGPPGTGKTSIIQAIANKLELNVVFASLSSIGGNETLSSLMSSVPHNSIIVMEDIDHLFETLSDSTASENPTSSLTMSGLLNVLDGIQGQEGSMIFMTCNNIDKIQPALLRPGRIDLKLKLDYAAPEQIRDTFWRFMELDDETSLPLEAEERAKVEELAVKFEKMIPEYHVTTAEIQSYFIDMLLEAKANDWTKENMYENMFKRIPAFMERVDMDRKQAEKHKTLASSKSSTAADDDKEKKTDTVADKEKKTDTVAEEEKKASTAANEEEEKKTSSADKDEEKKTSAAENDQEK